MMGASNIEFKEKFIERYEKLTDWNTFKGISISFLRRSVRVNTLKMPVKECKNRLEKNWIMSQVPWCKEGFWVEHKEGRRDIGNTIEHSMGYMYVQEAASMIPPIVLQPKPGDIVLDMCAAPGSKASQIAQYMENKGILIANDINGIRMAPLGINLQRCGATNCIITQMYGHWFKGLEFDKVLVDAPCSGTGTIRKSLKTLRIWNPDMVKRLASQQKRLIEAAFNVLKTGGTLVYSTCSCEPEEDEGVVNHLISKNENASLEKIELDIKRSDPVLEFEKNKYSEEVKRCLRIWPQDNDTEGFFVARINKL